MPEPQRVEPTDSGPLSEADRAARIEQLLLSGLDHYFGGNYEQAINVWTRVAFLERGHGRARAYIERARSALAERHRESEESLHAGVAAYQAGDLEAARELLTKAVQQGGANETALVFLQRLGRLDAATESMGRAEPVVSGSPAPERASRRRTNWVATVLASLVVALLIFVGALRIASALRESPVGAQIGEAPSEPLPRAHAAQPRLDRARELNDAGRALDALRELDAVDVTDPLRPDADRLRAEIQRAVLSRVGERGTGGPGGVTR